MAALRPAPVHSKEAAGLCRRRNRHRRAWGRSATPGRAAWLELGVSASGWPAQYEIRVAGVLDDRWVQPGSTGLLRFSGQGEETVICGLVADQPALH